MYATVDEFKAETELTDDRFDLVIEKAIKAASEAIDNYINRGAPALAITVATPKTLPARGGEALRIPDCVQITKVETRATPTDTWVETLAANYVGFAGDWMNNPTYEPPYSGVLLIDGSSFPKSAMPVVRVTARWGLSETIPPDIRQATLILSHRWFKRAQTGWGDSTASADFGGVSFRSTLDPDERRIIGLGRWIKPTL
jgi:hypothetical protein